jgi:hypothetical protein
MWNATGAGEEIHHTHVRENHPICQEPLFDWLYSGFGNSSKKVSSLLLVDDGEVVGFRGVIPQLYQVPVNKRMEILQGGSYAMWNIRQDIEGLGLVTGCTWKRSA